MIKMFDAFRRWCEQYNIPSADIEITIAPRSIDTMARFEVAWYRETSNLTLRPASHQLPTSGNIYGIPFRYRRPSGTQDPFGDTKG